MTAVIHSLHMTDRHLRALLRQPWYVAFSLIQPLVYLLLFGALFSNIAQLPAFADVSYRSYLTPGIVVLAALFSGGWAGVGVISDIHEGVLDRFLASRVRRSALVAGRLNHLAVTTIVQSLIIIGVALLTGVELAGGIPGLLMLLAAAVLVAVPIGVLSCAMSVMTRQEESVVEAVQFILMPLTFLSSVFLPYTLMPDWIATVARFNPGDWAVAASREALSAQPDWVFILARFGWLALLGLVCGWLATLAYRAYQRSL